MNLVEHNRKLDEDAVGLALGEFFYAMAHYGETPGERLDRIRRGAREADLRASPAALADFPGGDILDGIKQAADRRASEVVRLHALLDTLPCGAGVHATPRQDGKAVTACRAAGAHKTCEMPGVPYASEWCARVRTDKMLVELEGRLKVSRLPRDERAKILAGAQYALGWNGEKLLETPELMFARAIWAGTPQKVADKRFTHGEKKGHGPVGGVTLTGKERFYCMAGVVGVGKTLAAGWLIGRFGGIYVTAYEVGRAGVDKDVPTMHQLRSAPFLVIDQFGREHVGPTEYARLVIEEVLDHRGAELRKTVLIGNIEQSRLDDYEKVFTDRFRGFGAFAWFEGDSLR